MKGFHPMEVASIENFASMGLHFRILNPQSNNLSQWRVIINIYQVPKQGISKYLDRSICGLRKFI
jgi:hypothetical protein